MKNSAHDQYITIAKIGAPYGVRGWLKVQTFTDSIENAVNYRPWFVTDAKGQWSILAVEQVDYQSERLLIKIQGIDTPEAARCYTGKLLHIPRNKLPVLQENEYYWSDLEGLTVIDQHGDVLGKVSFLLETGSNDVLVVKGSKQIAVPYLPGQVIKSVSLDTREIHVEWEALD